MVQHFTTNASTILASIIMGVELRQSLMEITNCNTSIQKGLNRAPFDKIGKSGGNGHSGDVFRNLMEE